MSRNGIHYWSLVAILAIVGCDFGGGSDKKPAADHKPVNLIVVVVDDPQLSDSIRQRWQLEGDEDGSLDVQDVASAEFFRDDSAWDGDIVIYPSVCIGELASRGWIEPLRRKDLSDVEIGWQATFPLLRRRECTWDSEPYGLSFGSPVPVLFYRRDFFAAAELEPPTTWEEYAQVVEHFSEMPEGAGKEGDNEPSAAADDWHATIEPLSGPEAGLWLMARGIGYSAHRGTLSPLFDMTSTEPRINSPPFQRAAAEMKAVAKPSMLKFDGPTALAALLSGNCAMTLGFLEPIGEFDTEAWEEISVAPLPRVSQVYDRRRLHWSDSTATTNVPLLAFHGRIGSIAARTTNRRQSLNLLVALAGRMWGDQVAPSSHFTTGYREDHVGGGQIWAPRSVPIALANEYLRVQSEQLSVDRGSLMPRIRGGARLSFALSEAVRTMVAGEKPVDESLSVVAQQWTEILEAELPTTAQSELRASEGF
jgi:hypothetical protein